MANANNLLSVAKAAGKRVAHKSFSTKPALLQEEPGIGQVLDRPSASALSTVGRRERVD
jgi:hypothetical protein